MSRVVPVGIASLPWGLFGALTGLALFGTAVLYSAAGGSMSPWAGPHLQQFVLFSVAALIVRAMPLTFIRSLVVPAYVGCVLLLILVEVIGQFGGGSKRWLNLGFMTLQPSELTKLAVVLALARFYETLPPVAIRGWTAVWPAALMLLVPAGLTAMLAILGGMSRAVGILLSVKDGLSSRPASS